MQRFARQTDPFQSTSFPDLPSIISSHLTADSSPTTGPVSTNSSGPTSNPLSPPPTSVNTTTTASSTSETTSKTTTSTTTTPPVNSTDTTPFSTTPQAPVTPPPLVFTPIPTPTPTFNATTPSVTATFTTIVTSIDGEATTVVSQLPTALINDSPSDNQSNTHRTTIIAGTTTALFVFILSILAAIFVYRRHNLRKALAVAGQRKEGRGLLDGEDFDDDDIPSHMRTINSQRHSLARSTSPAPSLLKSRVAATGSIFREEIWPPPGFVDPISKRSSQVDLSKIVDDVMGPSPRPHEREFTDATTTSALSEFSSSTTSSNPNPFEVNDQPRASSSSLGYNDPFGASSSQASFYPSSYLPPGASPPVQPGLVSPSIPASSTSSSSRGISQSSSQFSSGYMSVSGSESNRTVSGSSVPTFAPFSPPIQLVPPLRPLSGSTTPRKSSPLTRALSDRDKMLWPGGPAPPEPAIGPFH